MSHRQNYVPAAQIKASNKILVLCAAIALFASIGVMLAWRG